MAGVDGPGLSAWVPADGDDGDVVVLAPGWGGVGDLLRGLGANVAGAVEAEEFAG